MVRVLFCDCPGQTFIGFTDPLEKIEKKIEDRKSLTNNDDTVTVESRDVIMETEVLFFFF